jgi:hypothetical protein
MSELFVGEGEFSHELEIFDRIPAVGDADLAITLFQSHVRNGMNPEEAKEKVIGGAKSFTFLISLGDQSRERPSS